MKEGCKMFGYILPEKPELKIREYELFRAYYCGVCKSIGKRYGLLPRLTLNYDSTFLALVLSSYFGETTNIKNETCIAHPISKRKIIKNSDIVDYASDMNTILAYYNLEDNWKDEGSILSASGMVLLKSAYRKISQVYPEKCDIIRDRLEELSRLEKQKCNSMDKSAEPFAKLMEEVTAYDKLCNNEKNEKILRWLGYNIGKWIYILDAYDDIEKDAKQNSYNPLIYQFDYNENEEIIEFKKRIRDRVEFNLTYSLGQIAKAYELMEIKANSGLVENIIYLGMLRKTEQILGTGSCSKSEKSV